MGIASKSLTHVPEKTGLLTCWKQYNLLESFIVKVGFCGNGAEKYLFKGYWLCGQISSWFVNPQAPKSG
jgi:hypothetical protein